MLTIISFGNEVFCKARERLILKGLIYLFLSLDLPELQVFKIGEQTFWSVSVSLSSSGIKE